MNDHAACESQCQFQPGTPTHSQFTLSPPEKDQSHVWKQPHPQFGSPAPEPRQPRQRLKMSLPANTHRPAMRLTREDYDAPFTASNEQ